MGIQRTNFGNITTNGMQILSVGTTTASRMFGNADKVLNNLTKEERTKYYQKKADDIRAYINSDSGDGDGGDGEPIDAGFTSSFDSINKSPQSDNIRRKSANDNKWTEAWRFKYGNGEYVLNKLIKKEDK